MSSLCSSLPVFICSICAGTWVQIQAAPQTDTRASPALCSESRPSASEPSFSTAGEPAGPQLTVPSVDNMYILDGGAPVDLGDAAFLPTSDLMPQMHYVSPSVGRKMLTGGGNAESSVTGELVYSNTGGTVPLPPGPGRWVADDINTVAVGGCACSGFRFMVGGGGDGTGPAFTVSWKMYDACPGADGEVIPGSEGSLTLPDDGLHLVEVDHVGSEIQTENGFWFAVMFDTWEAGWVTGAPASVGFTGDFFDWPYLRCVARFQGTPYYAGFYFESFCNDNPTKEFIAYYNAELDGGVWVVNVDQWVADDVELMIDDCELSSLEVGVQCVSGPYTVEVELWRQFCGPEHVIEGTQKTHEGFDTGSPQLVRFVMLDEQSNGIPLGTDTVWVAWKFDSPGCGPLIAGEPEVGGGQDLYAVYDGDQCIYYWFGGDPFAGFNATVKCLGEVPTSACCDMTEPETTCYENLPHSSCFGGPHLRWKDNATCDPDPFDPPCGTSACCKPDDTCENLFEEDCLAIQDPEGHSAVWQRGQFCNEDGQYCPPFWACYASNGDCMIDNGGLGCRDAECCDEVCLFDPWCCDVEWDGVCVRWAQTFCEVPPGNDVCWDLDAERGALPVLANSATIISNRNATVGTNDPGYCCYPSAPGGTGRGTVWFTFEATDTTARIHTCEADFPDSDSILAVYRADDPSTPETACNTLVELACNNDSPGCGDGSSSDLCVAGLIPGDTYYVQLANLEHVDRGMCQLTIESPCPAEGPLPACPPGAIAWLDPPDGVVDARQPHPVDDSNTVQGIDMLTFHGPEGSDDICCWALCETDDAGSPNELQGTANVGDGVHTISLARPITPGAVTTLTYRSYDGSETTWRFTAHPANVDGDSNAAPADILAVIDVLNGVRPPLWDLYSCDADHSGACDSADILCVIDLLNGAGEFVPWNGTPLPESDGICP